MGKLRRRAITFPALALILTLALATAPLLLLLASLIGLVRRRSFIGLRMLLFVYLYLALEPLGLAASAWLAIRWGSRPEGARGFLAVQRWWEGTLFRAIRVLLGLRFEAEGEEALAPGRFLLFVQHASLIDTLLPGVFVAGPRGYLLRYVVKKELLLDPCFDVVGNRLPNHFVDRDSGGDRERAAVRALAADLGPDEGVFLCPEGTIFTPRKRARVLERLEREGSPLLERARGLRHVLPPRLGGALALLEGAEGADVVFFAHRGLDPFAYLKTIFSGTALGRTIRLRFWRVPAAEIPKGEEARVAWLFEQWAEVDRFAGGEG